MAYKQGSVRDMFNRVLDILPVEFADLPAGSAAADAAADLQTQYNAVISESGAQSGFEGTGEEGTVLRAVARQNIRDWMSTLGRTARSISRQTPGFDKNYPPPSGMDDTELLNEARAIAPKAIADKTIFIGRGLTNAFITSIDGFITDFDASQDTTNAADGSRGAAVSEKNTAYEKGLDDVDVLNDFIRNFYRTQPAKLAAWKIASHIERSPKKKP
ncbi:hypothetical protein BH10ACI1_BH10ACI1_35070 [soil metagenome]